MTAHFGCCLKPLVTLGRYAGIAKYVYPSHVTECLITDSRLDTLPEAADWVYPSVAM
jgi:hypothetical protein